MAQQSAAKQNQSKTKQQSAKQRQRQAKREATARAKGKQHSRPNRGSGPRRSRGLRNIRWIEKHCVVPDGKYMGQNVRLRAWQKRIIRGIYDEDTRRAIISVGRKNAKTALSSFLLQLHLAGPEAQANSELYSTALSHDQASVIFNLAAKSIRQSPSLKDWVKVRDTIKQLECREINTKYTALSADASTAFGKSPIFIVHDELGQVRGPRHPLYEALETATGAHENPLSVIISTQAPGDNDILSILIDDALQDNDPRTKIFLWTADEDLDPFSRKAIRQANPAFGDFQNSQETLEMAENARRMPTREAEYRNLVLNQRVEAYSPFVTRSVWDANGAQPAPEPKGALFGGLDLSEVNDLTSLVLLGENGECYDTYPIFWLPAEGLTERSRQDRVQYDVWHEDGHLETTPGNAIEYEFVASRIAELFMKHDIKKIRFDRYNMRHLKPWLLKAGMSDSFIEDRFEVFGQGTISMGPALRKLESLLLNGRIRHGGHPVLRMCAQNAVVKMNEAGDRKLDKKRSRGRIDGMVALAMAASAAEEHAYRQRAFPVDVERLLE